MSFISWIRLNSMSVNVIENIPDKGDKISRHGFEVFHIVKILNTISKYSIGILFQ